MEYQLRFSVPDHLDPLLDITSPQRRKYINDKFQEFVRELLTNEIANSVDHEMIKVVPQISRVDEAG